MVELLVVFAVTAAVVGLAGKLPDARKVKRMVGMARIQRIESLTDGAPAAIRGEVAVAGPEATATGPLSDRPCVYWVVVFDEVGVGGDFREIGRAVGGHPFVLRGEAASARIVPDDPRIAVPPLERTQLPGSFTGAVGELAKRVCRRLNYPHSSYVRVTEYAVLPGMTVTILGWCTFEPDPEATAEVTGYRKELPTRPVISGTRRHRLMIG